MGLFSRLKEGLAKTRETLVQKVTTLVSSRTFDDALFNDLEDTLLLSDVGAATAETLIKRLKDRVRKSGIKEASELVAALKDEMRNILVKESAFSSNGAAPYVILVVGVNGVGKTTTIGKMAHNFSQAQKKVLIGAADTFRAAANEQLDVWAKRAQVEIIGAPESGGTVDPGAVAFNAVQTAVARKSDVVIIDTAGRLHTKTNLMQELQKIRRVIQKVKADAPNEVLLVLDATTGQNAIQQAKHFTTAVQVTGLVLTKLDGTAKGGVVFAIAHELGLPVRYIGVGEGIDDLQPFDPTQFIDALFGDKQE
jgi:fused signal recognition particle receptor